MKIYKAYKFRMYPDLENKIKLNQFLGTTRFIYNYYLNKKGEIYNNEIKNLSVREYVCKKCQNTLDRDINASINIMDEGIRLLYIN